MSTTTMGNAGTSVGRLVLVGAIAGIAGGVVFGIMMGAMGMLPMVGMLVGQDSAVVGFVVHLIISAFIGATFGVIASRFSAGWTSLLIAGGLYGVVWWVLGALILMPLMLGMNEMVLAIGEMQINSLIGHVLFGLVMGATYKLLHERL